MRRPVLLCVLIILALLGGCRRQAALVRNVPEARPIPLPAVSYPWMAARDRDNALANRVRVPEGYARMAVQAGSFGEWLRFLPLKPGRPPVLLYNGQMKGNQQAHVAVVKLDVGMRDLQQCADAVMRLRGEYLYSRQRYAQIHFNFTNGARADFSRWAAGYRPLFRGNSVQWTRAARANSSHVNFRAYMDTVFTYAGTASLSKELHPAPVREMRIGDVFIHGGSPGHAVIVVDMAVNRANGKRLFLLAQSYMPAQEMHLLRNPLDERSSPWYALDFGDILETPEYTFTADELKRF